MNPPCRLGECKRSDRRPREVLESSPCPHCRAPGRYRRRRRHRAAARPPSASSIATSRRPADLTAAAAEAALPACSKLSSLAGAKSGLARGRMVRIRRVAAQPHVLHPERGGGANDRPHVEGLAHRVEQQADPCLRGLAPGPIKPLDLGLAELTGHGFTAPRLPAPRRVPVGGPPGPVLVTFRTRYPDLAAARSAIQPESASHRCSESEPRLRCTTRNAVPPGPSRPATRPAARAGPSCRSAPADSTRSGRSGLAPPGHRVARM